jgi:tRNA-specific 2-thiouridylase
VQLRAHGETFAATCWAEAGSVRIELHGRARGVARGQAAVLYDGDVVLGSATIAATACRERMSSS